MSKSKVILFPMNKKDKDKNKEKLEMEKVDSFFLTFPANDTELPLSA